MTQQHFTLRPAMTAIAAVLALSATPALAQDAGVPDPVIETTPAPAPASPDPLSPAPTVSDTAPEPVVSESQASAPAATTSTRATATRQTTRATANRRASSTAPRATAQASAAPATPALSASAEPVAVPPEAAAPIAVPPVAVPAAAEPAPATTGALSMDETLPIAGAAGLGLLALAGAGMAVRRRRRRADDALSDAKWQQIDAASPEPDPAIEPAPTFVRAPRPEAVPAATAAAANASDVPDGFDLSRFGPHVQAAYRGPTADNPSASLKRRLTVGHFLDKQAAEVGPAETTATSAPTPAARPAWAASKHSDFMLRRAEAKPALRPAYQK